MLFWLLMKPARDSAPASVSVNLVKGNACCVNYPGKHSDVPNAISLTVNPATMIWIKDASTVLPLKSYIEKCIVRTTKMKKWSRLKTQEFWWKCYIHQKFCITKSKSGFNKE